MGSSHGRRDHTAGFELAEQKAEREKEEIGSEIDREITALRTRTGAKRGSTADSRRQGSGLSVESDHVGAGGVGLEAADETKYRVLVDPDSLIVVEPSGQVVDGSPRNTNVPRRGGGLVEPDVTRSPGSRSWTPLRGYSDLERETVGFELARKVLSSDHKEIVDLRAQRAKNSPDFFLVVISGVEGMDSKPRVRIIPKPLDQLDQRVSGTIKLSGVRHAKSVTFKFASVEDVLDGGEVATQPE